MGTLVAAGRARLFFANIAQTAFLARLTLLSAFAALIFVPAISEAQITYDQFKMLKREFHAEYDAELARQNAALFFNKPPTTGADRFWTVDAAMLTLCHEVGHGIAGAPHKNRDSGDLISIEALADDYAIRVCFPRMTKRIEAMTGHLPLTSSPFVASTPFVDATCAAKFTVPDEKAYCIRAFHALEFERIYYANDKHNPQETSFESKDSSVVSEINTGDDYYPSAQCRIDTMVAGVLNEARPACWWPAPAKP